MVGTVAQKTVVASTSLSLPALPTSPTTPDPVDVPVARSILLKMGVNKIGNGIIWSSKKETVVSSELVVDGYPEVVLAW